MKRRIAFSIVKMPDGNILKREVVEFTEDGNPLSHFPLTGELPFVEWHDEIYVWGDSRS